MRPRSLASSQTGRRGHDVRQASMTSRYGLPSGPIHSSRSRVRASTGLGIIAALGIPAKNVVPPPNKQLSARVSASETYIAGRFKCRGRICGLVDDLEDDLRALRHVPKLLMD